MLIYLFALQLFSNRKLAMCLALVYGFFTMAWPYSKYTFSEPPQTLCILLSFYALKAYTSSKSMSWLLLSGLGYGMAILTKVASAVFAPAILLYFILLMLSEYRANPNKRARNARFIRQVLYMGIGFALPVGTMLLYNTIRFGHPLLTGYGSAFNLFDSSILVGLHGLLLSTGKSIFLYSLPAVLSIPAFIYLMRSHRNEAVVFLLAIVSNLLFYASLSYWHGDTAWGPRYLVPIEPYLVLPLGALLPTLWRRRGWRISLAVVAAVWFLLVQAPAVITDPRTYIGTGTPHILRYYSPVDSPIVFNLRNVISLVRNWSINWFAPATEVLPPYQGEPGKVYVDWLLTTKHSVKGPDLVLSDTNTWCGLSVTYFYSAHFFHLVDAWWWYIARYNNNGWLTLLGLIPLGLVAYVLYAFRRSRRLDDIPVQPTAMAQRAPTWLISLLAVFLIATNAILFSSARADSARRLNIDFASVIRLCSYSMPHRVRAGHTIELRLYWECLQPVAIDYSIFAHLLDANGTMVAQKDSSPVNGRDPTSGWYPGYQIADFLHIQVPPDLEPGQYEIIVGIYDSQTMERLTIDAVGTSQVSLGTITVTQ
ncbi:MAG: hypothetical protein GXY52_01985 [Chloroflexi bacterium]|nr:hypothetical protein [Chloroflexota bacterium]